ncbi:MAG TPA: hypothetical protein VN426_12625 [Syntrophomonadaceae bacterium]|nr:hypothetical protein [Syntrophomonadaceae bacterium]
MVENAAPQQETESDQDVRIAQYHEYLTRQYPGLSLRWSRIYGNRWAHILGGRADVVFFPLKVELNQHYGVCIENPEILAEVELGRIITMLREVFRKEGS